MREGVQFQYEFPFIWPMNLGYLVVLRWCTHPRKSVWPSSQDLGLPPHNNRFEINVLVFDRGFYLVAFSWFWFSIFIDIFCIESFENTKNHFSEPK